MFALHSAGGFRAAAAIIVSLFLLPGCGATSERDQTTVGIPKGARVLHFDSADGRNVRTLAFGEGVACQANGVLGPLTFSVADIGKPGVRRLTPSEATVLARIPHYVASPALRFTWLGGPNVIEVADEALAGNSEVAIISSTITRYTILADFARKSFDTSG